MQARCSKAKLNPCKGSINAIASDPRGDPGFLSAYTAQFGKRHHKKSTDEGGEQKAEPKAEPKSDQKVDASPSLFPARHSLGLTAQVVR